MEGQQDINIQHHEVWELLVSIEDKRVNYILYTPTVANSLIVGDVAWTGDSLSSLEDVIYDTPILLNDYRRVRVLVHSPHFVLLPNDTSDEDCKELLHHAFPDDDGDAAVCPMPSNDVKIAHLMPRGMQAFLGRTFNYPSIYHHLFPLGTHFKEINRGTGISRMFLNLEPDSMDVMIYRDGELQCANSYPFTSKEDATYFALNAWRAHGLDQLTDELQLTGDRDMRASMTPVLREYVKYVMSAVYLAAAMQLGHNAMQAPLELILLALCE